MTNNSIKNLAEENDISHRVGILKDIINDVKKFTQVKFCAALSINPLKLKIHGNIYLWQKGLDEIEELTLKYIPSWLQEIINQTTQANSYLIDQTKHENLANFLADRVEPTKSLMMIPFFTSDKKKLLALLFIGYEHVSFQDILQEKVPAQTKHYEHSLEETWLVGKYKVIADIGKKINETLEDHQQIFDELLEKASSILDTSYYFLLGTYNPQTETFDKYEYYKYNDSPDKKGYRPNQKFTSSLELVFEGKEVLAIFNYEEELITNPKLKKLSFLPDETPNPQSIIYVPLLLREDFLGVLSIQHEEPDAFNWEDVRMMELLGNQVSQALNSIRLYRHLENVDSAIAQLISPLSQERSEETKTKGILRELVSTIKKLTHADLVVLFPYSSLLATEEKPLAGFEPVRIAGDLYKRKKEDLIVRYSDDMSCLILRKFKQDKNYTGEFAKDSRLLYESLNGNKERKGCFERDEKIKSCVAMPLKIEDEFVGALFINFRKPQIFSDLQKLHINTLAKFAALSIRIQRDFFSSKQKYLQAFKQIDSFIGKDFSLDEVMKKILIIAVDISKAVDSAIYLYDPQNQHLKTSAFDGPHQDIFKDISIEIREEKGLVTKAFLTRQPQMDNNVQENPDYLRIIEETVGELDVPLIDPASEEAIGVISLESTFQGAFHEEDKEFLTSIASQAALAIKVAQAKEKSTQAVMELGRQIKTMKERSLNIITQRKEVTQEIQEVVNTARELMGAEIAILQLFEDGKPTTYFKSIASSPPSLIMTLEGISPNIENYGIIKWVAENKCHYNTGNTDNSELYQGSSVIKSELAVPLELEGEVYAVLDVESVYYNAFNQEHVNKLTEFAILAVLVAQTANRALRGKQENKRFKLLNQSMFDFGRVDYFAPVAKQDIEKELYKIVLDTMQEFRDEGEMLIRRFNSNKTSFDLVDSRNPYQMPVPPSIPYYKDGQIASLNAMAAERVNQEKFIYVPDLDTPPPDIVQPFSDPRLKCIVVVPIISGSNNYGNIIWSHTQKNFFDRSDILLIRGLASQLGASLLQVENANRTAHIETFAQMAEPVTSILHNLTHKIVPINVYVDNIVNALSEKFESDPHLKKHKTKIDKSTADLKSYIAQLKDRLFSSTGNVQIIKTEDLLSGIADLITCPNNIIIVPPSLTVSGQLRIDVNEINEIFQIILENAVSIMPEGGEITIFATKRLNNLIIEISDTGPGIPEAHFELIFEPKYSTKGSTGLGLWSARRKASRNFGELYVVSSEKGAKFVLELPIEVSSENA